MVIQIIVHPYHGDDSAIMRNEVLLHTTTWMNFQRTRHSEKSQFQRTTYWMIQFIQNHNWDIHRDKMLGKREINVVNSINILKTILKYLFIYFISLAVLGLSCGMWDPF